MVTRLTCSFFYSITGDEFNICDRYINKNVARTSAQLLLQIPVMQPAFADEYIEDHFNQESARLSIEHEIPAGNFFISETHCILINGKNQVLRIGDRYRFNINLYRSLDNPSMLRVFFTDKHFDKEPVWISL